MFKQKRKIIIATSFFGNPVSDYYNFLADEFIKNNFKIIFIFDGSIKINVENSDNKSFLVWPSNRPTNLVDFCFFYKLIKKERPVLCISNFGSTNVVSIVSFFFKIKNRINYVHTTSTQLSIDSNKNAFKNSFLKYRKKLVYNLNTLLFTNSNGTKNDVNQFYKIENNKIKVIPLLIKESSIKYKKFDERENSICIVGRLHSSKGHKELLHLFKRTLINFPKLKLKIIGEGYLKTQLIELSNELNISKNVIFKGNIPNEEIGQIFSSSLVSISSSIDEAYGLVNIEALREGTPLICTKTAGSLDILSPEINGVFMSHNEKSSLESALTIVLNNWEYYSQNAIKTFNEKFRVDNIENHVQRISKYCCLK